MKENGDLNRQDRRLLVKTQKQRLRSLQAEGAQQYGRLVDIEDVFDVDDDLSLLRVHFREYKDAQTRTKLQLMLHDAWRDCGVSEETLRKMFLPNQDSEGLQRLVFEETNNPRVAKLRSKIKGIQKTLKNLKIIEDEDERMIVRGMMDVEGITVREMFFEIIKSRDTSIDLIRMQIEYLEFQEKLRRKQEEERRARERVIEKRMQEQQSCVDNGDGPIEINEEEMILVEAVPSFGLDGWEIYWSDKFWSDNPNHLVRVTTESKEQAVEDVARIGRGRISINPHSVVRALEFHLETKDRIQKALSARNKYVPPEIRKWIKVKRGKDRIGILVESEDEKRAVFFVGGRDEVYASL